MGSTAPVKTGSRLHTLSAGHFNSDIVQGVMGSAGSNLNPKLQLCRNDGD
jgi:hypothetical protein